MKNISEKKETVGILTFFDGINHGAFLQCYALYKTINNYKNKDVFIISYKNPIHWAKEYKIFLWTKNPRILINNIKKIIKFKKEQKLFQKTKFTFSKDKIPYFDTIIVGSDIVWNYENPLFGCDLVYFGKDLKFNRLISYAPSFGAINKENKAPVDIIERIKNFNSISVRDENSRDILKMNSIDCSLVLDPTFLYSFEDEAVTPKTKDPYILIYAYTIDEDLKKNIIDYAISNGLKIIAIGYDQSWTDVNIISVSPFEWVGFFKKAKYVVTSTFHGTIFSLKFKKKFIIIPNKPINNKIKFILNHTGQTNRIYYKSADVDAILNQNYNQNFDLKIDNLINSSIDFLNKNFE
jgi:polysaccharide pyruvyl transferase WcaK-like protein